MHTAAGSRPTRGAPHGSARALWRELASVIRTSLLALACSCAAGPYPQPPESQPPGAAGQASAPRYRNLPSDLEILQPAPLEAPGAIRSTTGVKLNVYSAPAPSLPSPAQIPNSPAASGKHPLIAVIDLDSETLGTAELRAVANAIHTQFSRDANMGLLPQSGVRDRLEYLGILPYDPYGPPPSPFDIAKAVRADYLVMGELNRAGGAYSLQTQLYSASKNRVVQSDSQVFQGGLPELLGRLPALVEKLGQNIAAASKTYAPPASAPKPSVKKDASTIKQAAPVNPEYPAPAPPPDSTNASAKMQQELDALQQHVRDLRESLEAQVRQTQMHKEQSESNRAELDALRMELEAERQRRERAAAEVAPMRKAADIAKAAKAAGEAKISGLSPEQIVAKLRLAVGLDPSVADYHIDLAKTLYATGAYDAALEACGIGIGHHALDATLLILKGACYFSKADGIVKSRPRGDAMAMSHASMLFAMAEEAYRQARAADPDNAYAQYNLALTIQTSDTDNSRVIQALREWDRYFALAQGDPEQAEWMKMAREIKKPLDAASP